MNGVAKNTSTFYRRLAEHDPAVLNILFRHARLLEVALYHRFGHYLCDDDLRDIVADALIHAWEIGHRFDPTRADLKSWLVMLAVFQAREFLRRSRRANQMPLECADQYSTTHDVCDSAPDLQQPSIRLKRVLDQLPARRASVMYLHYYDGQSVAEIAQRLEISESAVKSHLSNGRASLRQALEAERVAV